MTAKTILISPCGMGLGHASRMLTLGERLSQRGFKVVFSSYGDAVNYIVKHGYICFKTSTLSYKEDDEGGIAVKDTLASGIKGLKIFLKHIADEVRLIASYNPSLVISDSRLSTLVGAYVLGVPSILVANQLKVPLPVREPNKAKLLLRGVAESYFNAFLEAGWSLAERIYVPDFPPPYTISKYTLPTSSLRRKMIFAGPLLSTWPEELPPRDVLKEKLRMRGKRVVLIGISGLKGERENFLKSLARRLGQHSPLRSVVFIMSKGNPSGTAIRKIGNAIIYDWLPNRYEWLKACDLVITHGGHTSVIEALIYGVPAIHVPNPGHLERFFNAKSAEELGVALLATPQNLGEKVLEALEREELSERTVALSKELAIYRGDVRITNDLERLIYFS